MKSRKVIITIETKTELTIKDLLWWKGRNVGPLFREVLVDQIQVNVVKPTEHGSPRL